MTPRRHSPLLALLALAALTGCREPPPPAAATAAAPAPPTAATPAELPTPPGHLVFLAEDGASSALVHMRPDGQARRELQRGTGLYPAALDPQGAALAVIVVEEHEDEHREHIEVRPLTADGLGPATWTSEVSTHVRSPTWGPDGSFIVFEAAFTSFRDIYRVDLPAGTLTRLTDNAEGNFEPALAPDGRSIAFVSSRDGNAEIYRMHVDGLEPTRLTHHPLDDWGPIWSPDGQTLAFLSNRELVDRIFLMHQDGSALRRLTPDPTPSRPDDAALGDEPHEADPAFSPDSAALAYCVRTGSKGAALRLAPTAGGPIVNLTEGSVGDRGPVWSPDGAQLVFVSNRDAGDLELYRIARDGAGLTRLTHREGPDWLPRWAPAAPQP